MIRFCTCTGGSSSSLLNKNHREGSETCKSCGGKLLLDGRGALSSSTLSTVGEELSGVIENPHWNWNTASKGRQRAVRRARASFTSGNKKKPIYKSSKESEDLTFKDSKMTAGMAVSEFEKLGVSILGRRFSDTIDSVPIKKRRFLFARSSSPPHQSSSHSVDSDQIREIESATYEESASNTGYHALDVNSGARLEFDQERPFNEKSNGEDLNKTICDSTDLSGMSILAEAACNSSIGGDVVSGEDSLSREPKSEETENETQVKKVLGGKTETPSETSTTLVMPSEESEMFKVGGSCSLETSMRSSPNFNTARVESSSRGNRFHWDLNTPMDEWDSHSDEILNSGPLDTNIITKDQNEKLGNLEPPLGFSGPECPPENTSSRDLAGVGEQNCVLEELKAQDKSKFSGTTSIADHNVGNELVDASVSMVDAAEKAKTLHGQEKRILTTTEENSEFSHPPLIHCECASSGHSNACKSHTVTDQIPEVVCEGDRIATSATDLDEHLVHCSPQSEVAHTNPIKDTICSSSGKFKEGSMSPGQVALEDHSGCDYYSDASEVDPDQPAGMEKVEFLRDEDYQYEDGEFRESSVNRWGDDGAEDGETEYVDYGSDNGEVDIFEGSPDFRASASLHVDGVEGKAEPLDAGKETQGAASLPIVECSLDAGPAKRTEAPSVSIGAEFLNERDASRKSSHLASFRVKSSGWDRLPGGYRGSERTVMVSGVDSSSRNLYAPSGTSNGGEPFRRLIGSSPRRGISSRADRPRSPDASRRRDKSYDRGRTSRPSDYNDLDSRASRPIRRDGSSLHMQRDRWLDSPDHRGSHPRGPYDCRGPASFTHSPSKNAAAATVAKLESNGFVVAADGTILKAGAARPAARVPQLDSSRERSPDRHIGMDHSRVRCGSRMTNNKDDRERYRGPIPDERSLHRSRTGSPRSRTRSPRIQRLRPHHQSDLGEEMVGYSRHASRWADERKLPDRFREHEHDRFPGRGRPSRVFSPGERLLEHSGTVTEYQDFDRLYEGSGDDRRGYGNRYEMPRPVGGSTKQFRYDGGDGFRINNTRPRASPRGFDRAVKEERVDAGCVRDGKHNASFKSFGVRDRDDGMTPPQRRRPL